MSQPTARQLTIHRSQSGNSGAQVKTVDPVNGVWCSKGDLIPHPSGGWHVCLVGSAFYPGSGIPLGSSTDSFHYSTGASFSGQGIPGSNPASATFDAVNTGAGTDGRASLDGSTYGGATGSAAGGVSGQATTGSGNTGGVGGGSAARGF